MVKFIPFKKPNLFSHNLLSILFLSFVLLAGSKAFGVTKTSTTSGTWATVTWSPVGLPVAGDDIVINTNVTAGPAVAIASFASFTVNSGFTFTHTLTAITITGNLVVDGTYQLTSLAMTVNGATSVSGTLNDNNSTALNRFDGLFTVGGTGIVSNTNNAIFEFRGGITNSGSFTISGTGASSFSTNNQTIQGNTLSFGTLTIGTGITVTSSGSVPVTFNGALTVTGAIDFTGAGTTTLNAMTCSGTGSMILQTLTLTGATISQTGTLTVLGATSSTGTSPISATAGLKQFQGLVTVSSGTFSATSTAPLEFQGGITNNGTLTISGTGGSTFSTSNQVLQGNLITFNAVTVSSGITLSSSGAVPITFNGSLVATGTINFTGAGTTTLNAITCSGAGSITVQTLVLTGATISQTGTLTVLGTTTSTGTSPISATAGLKQFQGLVTVTSGTMSSSSTAPLEFQGGLTATGVFSQTGSGTLSFTTNSQSISGGGVITFQNLSISSGITVTNSNTAAFTVSTTSTIDGVFSITAATGLKLFIGLPTISSTGSLTSSANATYEFRGGIDNSGTVSLTGTGAKTFSTNSQSLAGSGSITLNAVTINSPVVVTNNNTGTTTITGALALNGTLTDGNNGGSNVFGGLITLSATGNLTTTNNSNYDFQGGITTVAGSSVSLTGTGTINFSVTQTVNQLGPITLGNMTVSSGATLSMSNTANFTNNGTTTVDGAISVLASGGTKLFVGLVTVSASGSFSNNNAAAFEFRNGISHNGTTFSLTGAGAKTFSTNNQSIGGSSAISIANVTVSNITLTNNGTFTVATSMDGPGSPSSFIQGSSSTLNYAGATGPMGTAGCTFTSAAANNTVNYNAAGGQSVRTPSSGYYNLAIQGSGSKTISADPSITGTLSISGTAIFQAAAINVSVVNVDISGGSFAKSGAGTIVITGLTTFSGSGVISGMTGNPTIDFQGGITYGSTGATSTGTGTVTFSINNQTISGAGSGTLTFGGAVQINDGISVTSQRTVSITGNLDGTLSGAQWINANGSTLNYSGTAQPFNGSGSLDASANSNTINYSGAAQTIRNTIYHHLSISGSGIKTLGDVTVNGNFAQTAGTLSSSGTQTFTSSNAATISTTGSLNNINITKTGTTLTLASNVSASGALSVSSGTLVFGGTARTFTLTGDLTGGGTIDMSGIAGNILILNGTNNSIGTYTSLAGNTVTYSKAGAQTIFSSANYRRLSLGGSGIKSIGGNVSVGDTLYFTADLLLSLGSSNLTLSAGSRLRAGASGTNGTFSVTRMIVTDGTGIVIKEGTTATHFSNFSWTNALKGGGQFPTGTTGFYSPFVITGLTATVAGIGSVSVRAVPVKQPNVAYYYNALIKYWELSSSNLSAISANMSFTYTNPAEVIGSQLLYEGRVWNGSTLATTAGASAPGSNPFTTTGSTFISGSWTAIDPTPRNVYYSYITGNWSTAGTWTTDPSGSTLINSAVPGSGDQVVILNGRTVTASSSQTTASLTINNGAVVDLGTSTGHNFGPVSGSGTLRLQSISLPTATYTQFVASSGGTIEYYDVPAGSYTLANTLATYNNLLITNSTAGSFTLVQDHNLTVNGTFVMSKSGSGAPTYQISSSASNKTLTVSGNMTIGTGCNVTVGTTNNIHDMYLGGNLTNAGTMTLSNQATPYLAVTNGRVRTNIQGPTLNTTVTNNGTIRFDQFFVNKTTGYEVFVSAGVSATTQFYANSTTIDPNTGTLRLGSNITIAQMSTSTGANYDLGSSSALPVLWVDGANVTCNCQALVPYGTLRVSAGTFTENTGQAGIVLRETGQLIIEGTGVVNAEMFRTSTTAVTHRGSYQQTGGTLNLDSTSGGGITYYSIFTLPYPDNVFKMTGGTINIRRTVGGGITSSGGIQIASTAGNYEVTGGTINVTMSVTSTYNFDIASAAPFYNLNIYRRNGVGTGTVRLNSIPWSYDGAAGNTVTYPAQPLVILNDFTINGTYTPTFNAQNTDLSVKGNFTILSGGVYQTGTQTTTFNGTSGQTFSVTGAGALSTGLSTLAITKSSSTLTLAGTTTPITVRGGLTLNSGTLADGGKTINVAGNVVNNGTHSGSGKIAMNGSTASQTLSGTGTAYFGNLDFSNTNGSSGSTQISVSCHLNLSGSLGLTTDRVTSIANKQIILGASSSITGTFSSNRFLKTSGNLSDGGIKKTFNSTAALVFPFGSGSNYTPATIQFTSAPTTYGALDIRPVATKQLYVTDPNCFDLYWKIKTTGFTGIPSNSVNYTFNYGSLTDNVTYIPAFYDQLAIAFTTINDVTKVDEATNNISFTGVSYTDGDYTAGNIAAFGVVTPFYSKTNGNWNTPGTWSNISHSGAAAVSIPASNSPVLIGDGSTYNHTVTVTTNSTISGSLIVDAGSVLDCQTTTGNNFGAIPYATAGGAGKIKISSAVSTAEFPAGDFGLFFETAGGICEYYSTGSQDFTMPTATASPTVISIDTYKNLIVAPGSGRTISFPDKSLTVYEDLTINGNSTGKAAFAPASSRAITVDSSLLVTQGIFELGSAVSQQLVVLGDASVSNGGTLRSQNSGSSVHDIFLEGNLFNEGIISLNNTSTSNLTFRNNGSKIWNGSNASSSVGLSTLVIDKGTSTGTELEVTTLGSFTSPTNAWLTLTNGMLKWSKGNTMTLTDQVGNFTIPSSAGFTVNHSSAIVNVGMANSASADVILVGKLYVHAGTFNIGDNANNHNNDLEYSSGGIPEFEVTGSSAVNINGQIRRSTVVQLGSLKYTQSGSSQVLVRGKNADAPTSLTYDRAKFEILNTGSEFNMSGSSVLTISRNGTASGVYYDIYLDPATTNISGGEVRIGNTSTPAGQTFFMSSTSPFWDFSVDGTTNLKTLTLVANPITIQRNFRVEGTGSIFNTAGLNVTVGGNFTNQNTTATADLVSGGYRATSSAQITTLNGSAASQTITGVSGNLTNFAQLVLNNTFPSGSITAASNTNLRVAGDLSITSGQFNSAGNLATVLGNVSNNGGHTSSGVGYLVFGGTTNQTISSSSTASFGSVRVNNAAGVEISCPSTISGDLNLQTGLFYINNYLLSLSVSSSVSGTFNSSSMIRLNGVTSDGGVTKSYPASASDFTFPIGSTLRYTPVRINVTSNTVAGTVNLKPVAIKHPATTDVANKELGYYWRTTSTGFNGSTAVNHTYNYIASDVAGTEASYVTGRFYSLAWTPTFGIPATVDATNHRFTLTGVNYFDGDFTAGESSEFNVLATYYSRNATLGGSWTDPNSWSNDGTNQHAGSPDGTYPQYNPVVIASGHTITVPSNGFNSVSSTLNGTLDLSNTYSHNFGNVSGTGRILMTPIVTNSYIFPGGDYSVFTSTSGGTFEYGGTIAGTLPTQATYHHLEFSGSATKSLPNANLTVNGNATITAGDVNNPNNKDVALTGDWTNTVGVSGFLAGTGLVTLNGSSQTLSGSTNFYKLTTSGAGVKTLSSSMAVTNTLTLTNGVFTTGGNTLTVNSGATVSGGSTASHINGTMRKGIAASASSTSFEIGDGTNYAPATISYSGTTVAGGFISASTTTGDHPNIYLSGIDQNKTANRYWTLTNSGVTGFTGYNATFNFVSGDLDVGAVPGSFILGRYSSAVWTQPTVGTLTGTSSQALGISGTVFGDFQVGQAINGQLWTGATSTNWNLAGNWLPTVVPTSSINAYIGSVTNQPNFTSGSNGSCKKLILYSGATVTIPTGYTLNVNDNIDAVSNTVDGVGTLNIAGASTLTGSLNVNCNLSIAASTTFSLGVGSTLNVGKDLAVTGTLAHNNLPVNFTGSNNSTISGTLSFYDLVVNKSSNTLNVTLGNNATVSHYLDMQSGDLELNGKILDLGTTGTLENETANNCVTGTAGGSIQATRTLNAPAAVNVGKLGAVITSAANLGSTLVERKHQQVVFGVGYGSNRVYGLHPTNNTALNATLVFNYFDAELSTGMGAVTEADLDLWRFNGTIWDRQYATVDMSGNTLTKTGIAQFSDWTSASYVNNPLAIDLAFQDVVCNNRKPILKWRTLKETDSKEFRIEASVNGRTWDRVGKVNAAGNSVAALNYQFKLADLPSSYEQVRLVLIENSGLETPFSPMSISCWEVVNDLKALIFPNPSSGQISIQLQSPGAGNAKVLVFNSIGQSVAQLDQEVEENTELKLDLTGLPSGLYKVQITHLKDGEYRQKSYSIAIR